MKLNNKFVVVIPVWNAENLIEECITSILSQSYDDIGIIIRDDMSTDNTPNIIKSVIKDRENIIFIENKTKFNMSGNIYDSVINYIDDNSVVGIVDGDDKLINNSAVSIIMDKYTDPNIWMVWSQHIRESNEGMVMGQSNPLPPDNVIKSRSFWSTSHFRTHRAKLFHHLNPLDLKDPLDRNEWIQNAGDMAYLYPFCEMCMNEHSMFIPDILYHYRSNLCTNDHFNDGGAKSFKYANIIRTQGNRYERLDKL